jgi:23S rRNA (guanosine2251-2'-O)-methyltransferase
MSTKYPAMLILHDIRSALNVGAIFRTADGAGVAKLYLTGYTPTPRDRFGRLDPKIAKTSLGASESMPWETSANIEDIIAKLKASSVTVVAVEQAARAIDYKTFIPNGPTAYIFGNEITGVPKDVLEQCDYIISISMSGSKESLNVATTAGIIAFSHRDS